MKLLADKIANDRDFRAKLARKWAVMHGTHTRIGACYTEEAEYWEAAASRARLGDLTPASFDSHVMSLRAA